MTTLTIEFVNESFFKIDSDILILKNISDRFKFRADGYMFDRRYIAGFWDGYIKPLNLKTGMIHYGYIKNVIKYCKENQIDFSFKNFKKHEANNVLNISDLGLKFQPYDYQENALELITKYNRGVILSATGSGKSLITYLLLEMFKINNCKNVLIVVPNAYLVKQLKSDFKDYDTLDKPWVDDVHLLYDGADKNINTFCTIATWQTLQNIKDDSFFEKYDALIIDECHQAKAAQLIKICEKCVNSKFKVGLTGSLENVKTSTETVLGLFGETFHITTSKELRDNKILSSVKVIALIRNLESPELNTYEEECEFIQNDIKRFDLILKLANNINNENTLVLFNRVDKFGKPLSEYVKANSNKTVYFVNSSTKIAERDKIVKEMENGVNIVVFATYPIFSTGVNVKNLHNLIFASSTKSFVKVVQSIGRILRLHDSKEFGVRVFDIVDNLHCSENNYSFKHYIKRKAIYEKEKIPLIEKII